jgi:outer membrane protein assembly factor BamB
VGSIAVALCTPVLGGASAAAVALSASGGAAAPAVAGPPPEWTKNAASWPSHHAGLADTRANLHTRIDAHDVHELRKRWTVALRYKGGYGAFTSNPDRARRRRLPRGSRLGHLRPEPEDGQADLDARLPLAHAFRRPNGVAYGNGLLFGETEGSVFALRPGSGKQVWIRRLARSRDEGIDMAPQLYDGKVLISTIPGSATSLYRGGTYGVVYALDARTGNVDWRFSTVKGGSALWGDPKRRSLVPAGRGLEGTRVHRRRQPGGRRLLAAVAAIAGSA